MAKPDSTAVRFRLVVHGGAGTIDRESMSAQSEREYRDALTAALVAGRDVLAGHGSALDAVVASVQILEDCPLFNAGRGAVFNADGQNELDAAIMDGRTLAAGAVAGVTNIKNPIAVARLVLAESKHVLLAGEGAERFAASRGAVTVLPDYFFTDQRWADLLRAKRVEENLPDLVRDHNLEVDLDRIGGTVGAVALDMHGDLAAGTSTGGITNKRFGRIGDSPIIGAGTYADNEGCAVSATGKGEVFIRIVAAHELSALMRYRHASITEGAELVMQKIADLGGQGGLIAVDRTGRFAMTFNTSGMYRGTVGASGDRETAIFRR
ncbi:MAG: isoaspartyl peptidase/L-asparaginase [Verrucomicrobia bacterium]|nr:isoaspartyl peptidase/L-asparaginase [Verrucomicrobiota bacterium]